MTQMADADRRLARLREVLQRLAEGAEQQSAYLQSQGFRTADELALEFDDSLHAVDTLVDAGLLTADGARLVRDLDRELATMSGMENEALWTLEALGERSEWEAVRELAEHARSTITPTSGGLA